MYTLDEMTRKLEVKAKDTSIEELRQVTGMMAEVVGETLEVSKHIQLYDLLLHLKKSE